MADGKIYIIVTDKLPGGMNPAPDSEPNTQSKEKESAFSKFAQHKFFNFIQAQTKQAINYSINNIGNFTGDYVAQQNMSDAMNILGGLMDIGTAALAGSKYGVAGALIAAGIAIAGKAITQTQQIAVGYSQNELQNRQIAQLRTRAGLNSTNNSSRGTEY